MEIKRRGFIMSILLAPFSRWLPKPDVVNNYPYTYYESFETSSDGAMFDCAPHILFKGIDGCIHCVNEAAGYECAICGRNFELVSWPTPKGGIFHKG